MELFLSYFLGFSSSLIVYYITENIKEIKIQKIYFHKLSLEIRDLLLVLTSLKSSGEQYFKSCENFKENKIDSIGFPDYSFPQIKNIIPFGLYRKESNFLLNQIIKLDNVSYSLNNFINNLFVNEIKEHFLSGKIPRDIALERYLVEKKIINEYLKEIDNYIKITFTILSAIQIINEKNSKKFVFKLDISYSDKELSDKITEIQNNFYNSFSTIEDVKY